MQAESAVSYYPLRFPQRSIVVENPTGREVADFDSHEEAMQYTAELTQWREAMPQPDRLYRPFHLPPEPTVAKLYALIDRIYEPDVLLDALQRRIWNMAEDVRTEDALRHHHG